MELLKKNKKKILIAAIALLVCIAAAIITIFQLNEYYLELSLPEDTITLEYGVDPVPEITAICKGTIINKEGTPIETTTEGEFDSEKVGTYEVTYKAVYKKMDLSEKRTFVVQDTIAPVIDLVADPDYFTSPIAQYVEEGFSATDNYDGDITNKVIRTETRDTVTYTVKDSSGNETTVERTIVYKDVVAPEISLTDGTETVFNVGSDYKDPGFTAADDVDGDITDKVVVDGSVDGHTEGTYTLTYKVADSSNNPFEIQRKVTVKDIKAPVITLTGDSSVYLLINSSYEDPGFSASDNKDGDVTSKVAVSGSVDTSKTGQYKITYSVSDSAGNTTSVVRTISVYEKQEDVPTTPSGKVVYLTFDDGPSKYTARLLDILDKYGVKATFFVTNQFPSYQYMIGETARRGHTIALHTYSHKYESVYASDDAYYADLQKIQDVVVAQTGSPSYIIRFPGGTNNTVSRKHSPGIMTRLSQSVGERGYVYTDWNVSSGDAGGTKSTSGVVNNVIKGIQKKNTSIVLQHDITSYSVEAVDQILSWGIANGYTFLPMTTGSPTVHYTPAN